MALLPAILSSLFTMQFVLGNVANGFIALVNCIDWLKGQKISWADRILTALALSRIGLLCVLLLNWYATVYKLAFYTLEVRLFVHIFHIVSHHFSLWFATSLSILYLLKIANFSSLVFLHLKWRAERVVLMMLWGTLVFLVCYLTVLTIDEKMQMDEYKGNITWKTNWGDIVHRLYLTVCVFANFIPFTMSLAAVLLLIFSMWKHLKKMQLSGKGSQDPSTEVHIRAMQTVISFLLLFVIYFFAQVILLWNSTAQKNNSLHLVFKVLAVLYPSSHSFILIWGNKKLRQAFLSFLRQLRCWPRKRK